MRFVLTILKGSSDALIIFPGFKTNFWLAMPIADIFTFYMVVSWHLTGFAAVIKMQKMEEKPGCRHILILPGLSLPLIIILHILPV